jgi:S1-C subfamily serine protease
MSSRTLERPALTWTPDPPPPPPREPATTAATTPASTAATGRSSLAGVAAAVTPSVVSITVRTAGQRVEGSGVIIRPDGLIATNNHVVADAAGGRVTVQLSDGRTVTATVVGTDPASDLAVLQAQGVSGLKAATFGDSDALQVGDTVLAVGNALGLEESVTPASSAPSTAAWTAAARARPSATPSSPTPRSTPATPAARWSTPPAGSSGSPPPTPASPGGPRAASGSGSRSPATGSSRWCAG